MCYSLVLQIFFCLNDLVRCYRPLSRSVSIYGKCWFPSLYIYKTYVLIGEVFSITLFPVKTLAHPSQAQTLFTVKTFILCFNVCKHF